MATGGNSQGSQAASGCWRSRICPASASIVPTLKTISPCRPISRTGAAARLARYIRNTTPLEVILGAREELQAGAPVLIQEGARAY